MPAVPLEVRVRSRPSESIIEVVGRLTVDSSPRLRAVLLDSIRARTRSVLVVDLLAVSYCDTSGIATLLEASIAPRNRSVRLRIIGVVARLGCSRKSRSWTSCVARWAPRWCSSDMAGAHRPSGYPMGRRRRRPDHSTLDGARHAAAHAADRRQEEALAGCPAGDAGNRRTPTSSRLGAARSGMRCSSRPRHSGVHRCASGQPEADCLDQERRRDSGEHRALRPADRGCPDRTTHVTNHGYGTLKRTMDATGENPWTDLRLYSNPIFITGANAGPSR